MHTSRFSRLLSIVLFFGFFFIVGPRTAHAEIVSGTVLNAGMPEEVKIEGFDIDAIEQEITVDMGSDVATFTNDYITVKEGQKVYISRLEDGEGGMIYAIYDINRTGALMITLLLFVGLVLALNFKKGVKSLLSLCVTGIVIAFVLLPLLRGGVSPMIAGAGVAIILLALVMLLTHGFTKKTYVAMIGTACAIVVTAITTFLILRVGKFSGIGTDESFAIVTAGLPIDMPELLFVGIIIGMLGILDDVAITQASVVQQLRNAGVEGAKLFAGAMKVGQDHVGALVNTLVLAYTGAALPLLLLTSISPEALPVLLSAEIVATEIIRALLGSIGIILTVPLTTLLATIMLHKTDDDTGDVHVHHGH